MNNIQKYNHLSRSMVNNARVKKDGKSDKDLTCDKLNNLLRDHPESGVSVIKSLVEFKRTRNNSWCCAGRGAQNKHLNNIEASLKEFDLSDLDNNYPTLRELEILVKNSSYFIQRDIPTHFRKFLEGLDLDIFNQIANGENGKFLRKNSIMPKVHAPIAERESYVAPLYVNIQNNLGNWTLPSQ